MDVAFSHNGSFLVTKDADLHLWDIATATEIRKVPMTDLRGPSENVAISPDDKIIASTADGTITLWDSATLAKQMMLKPAVPYHPGFEQHLVFAPDGKSLILNGRGLELVIWDIAARKEKISLPGFPTNKLALAPDGKMLACGGLFAIHFWDIAKERPLNERQGHSNVVWSVVAAPGGKMLASTASSDLKALLWDTATGAPLGALQGHQGLLDSCVFSGDGQSVATGARDGSMRLWDARTAKELRCIQVDDIKSDSGNLAKRFLDLHLSRDGRQLSAVTKQGSDPQRGPFSYQVSVWETSGGKCLFRRSLAGSLLSRFTPDGKGVAILTTAGLTIEELQTGRAFAPAIAGTLGGRILTEFSSDGNFVAMTTQKETPKGPRSCLGVFEVATGKEVFLLEGHESAAFSPNCRVLATATSAGIWLWDVATGKQLFHRPWPTELTQGQGTFFAPQHLCFLQNGGALAADLLNGTILVWDLEPGSRLAALNVQPLGAKELDALWSELGGDDVPKAYRAISTLTLSPAQAVSMLRDRLHAVPPADPKLVERLIADLESDKFAVRQTAVKDLATMGDQIAPALAKVLDGTPSLETRQRLQKVLLEFRSAPAPATLRTLRAIRALEQIGTAVARQVLQTLAAGAPQARETLEANAALERMQLR